MINLRYHIVSLTAVFLAIGIGLTLGSTFLDRATVENLNGQLDNLQGRLGDRETRINELEALVDEADTRQTALDEQAAGLLADRLADVPVVVVSSRGVDESAVGGAVQALVVAGADVRGLWWFTDRWVLDDEAEVGDLATVLAEETTDPSRLRRMAVDALGGELWARQLRAPEDEEATGSAGDDMPGADDPSSGAPATGDDPASVDTDPSGGGEVESDTGATGTAGDSVSEILVQLQEGGFIEFEAVPGGPESADFPNGTALLIVGGSPSVPDDLVVGPLVARMGRATTTPILAVASSALAENGGISDLVAVIREDEQLQNLISTVDDLEHFSGWAATVLALDDVVETGEVGHYGLDDSATRLLPPLRTP